MHLQNQRVCHSRGVALLSMQNGAQERKFVEGSAAICERIADRLGFGDVVMLRQAVTAIAYAPGVDGSVATVTACRSTDDGHVTPEAQTVYTAKRVIVALAPTMYTRLGFQPPLPDTKARPASVLGQATV